jgi:hypothetical protein
MSDLIAKIQIAQRSAAEAVVVAHLEASGLASKSEAEKLEEAKTKAHRALDEAERAWYAYAGMADVGPERTRAFTVYENVRLARRV